MFTPNLGEQMSRGWVDFGVGEILIPLEWLRVPLWGFHFAAVLAAPVWRVNVRGVGPAPVVVAIGRLVKVNEKLTILHVCDGCHSD